MSNDYSVSLTKWISSIKDMMENSYNDGTKDFKWDISLTIESGSRYDKIVKCAEIGSAVNGQRVVYAFIEKKTGDIFKPASWKAPAKHARGNIYADDGGLTCAGPYGIAYLR